MELFRHAKTFEDIPAGTVIVREGEKGDRMYVVQERDRSASRAGRTPRARFGMLNVATPTVAQGSSRGSARGATAERPMGIGKFLFDNELFQRLDIEDTKRALHAKSKMDIRARGRIHREVEALEDDLGTLALLCRAMMRMMIEKGVMSRDELVGAMKAIDAHDGKVDGRYTGPIDAP